MDGRSMEILTQTTAEMTMVVINVGVTISITIQRKRGDLYIFPLLLTASVPNNDVDDDSDLRPNPVFRPK